jgi:hypothetical protein
MMLVIRNAFLGLLASFYVGDSMPRAWRARFFDRAYFVFAGLGLLIFIFAIDGYLRDGLERNDAVRRFAKTIGLQLLILFPADLTTSLLQRSIAGSLSMVLLPLELLLGGALLAYAVINKPAPRGFEVAEG